MSTGQIPQLFSLAGKTAFVTGSTGGIGLVLTLALAEAGADIVSIQIPNDPGAAHLQQEVERHGRRFQQVDSNLRDYKSIPGMLKGVWDAGVDPDILLNCAGISRHAKVEDTPVEYLDDVMDINFKAAYMISQEFGRRLLQLNRPGKIIHIASMAAELVQTNISVYACSKAAVRTLTRALSNEWAEKGIQVNCISPGFVKTKMTEPLFNDPDFNKNVIQRTSSRRWSVPEDLRGVAIFLASAASDFMTGEEIVVDGGVLGR
ncbi:uncharacterized protein Z520_02665 [Fonsecaea multimorphosa CBS 102226]|uniref:2-deoxy-D-gluconate 3-dehydrogenase n=1 Tax=Fonsecaea multimorphosa CBS 102226 TaxID=1442371 RepID=A0A0D2K5M1_9EURO|nr:uncharacterized protein Z520_02665 [Fonsecaea multimorphosa CBS 102226]KIY01113.1 hypothetical protein Z520_02665 [Fonsecaea multimorphosa CBS 102226]OAL28734.1 hypothetical protein AYO22_02599 [Fonsecaea multimorphosa]